MITAAKRLSYLWGGGETSFLSMSWGRNVSLKNGANWLWGKKSVYHHSDPCSPQDPNMWRERERVLEYTTPQRQTAVTAYFASKQLLLFAFARSHICMVSGGNGYLHSFSVSRGGGVYGYRACSAKSKGSNCLLWSKQLLPLGFALHDAPGLTAVIVEACCTQSDRRHLKPQLRGERNSKPALTYSVCLFTELWIPDHCGLVYTDFSVGYAEGSLEVRFQSL